MLPSTRHPSASCSESTSSSVGDNDKAWQRAERFVSEEVRDRLLESRSQQ